MIILTIRLCAQQAIILDTLTTYRKWHKYYSQIFSLLTTVLCFIHSIVVGLFFPWAHSQAMFTNLIYRWGYVTIFWPEIDLTEYKCAYEAKDVSQY